MKQEDNKEEKKPKKEGFFIEFLAVVVYPIVFFGLIALGILWVAKRLIF